MPFDAIGLGLCAWDRLLLFNRYPGPDQKVQAISSATSGGGPVPTALAIFSRLGGKTAFIGVVGDDPEGKMIANDLIFFSVDTNFLIFRPQKRSPSAYIWVDKRDGRRTVALDPGDCEPVRAEELPAELIRRTPLLLTDGRDAATCFIAARLCHEGGGQVVLDAGSPRDRIEELLAVTDHAVVSEDFYRGTYPGMKLEQALRRIYSAGPANVVITCGPEGGFWLENGEVGRYSAFMVDVVDTTGAGDAFHGAYLLALSRKWDMEKRCRFSSGVAALVCRAMGGRSAAPTYAQAMEFVGQFE